MTTHILSMTYPPKIEGVRHGTIRQTIRRFNPERPFEIGDKLLIHGWEGKPYRSPWNWRMDAELKEVLALDCYSDHVMQDGWLRWSWGEMHPTWLAQKDGIEPPTGEALKAVLERFHGKFTDEPVRFQVIRW